MEKSARDAGTDRHARAPASAVGVPLRRPEFLAISRWTPVVRRLDIGTPRPPLELSLPIRILSLVSAPSDAEPIDAERERVRLTTALQPLVAAGAVSIDWLDDPTLLGLTRQLDDHDYHVLHFIGHGGYEESMEDGVLLFEDGDGPLGPGQWRAARPDPA